MLARQAHSFGSVPHRASPHSGGKAARGVVQVAAVSCGSMRVDASTAGS